MSVASFSNGYASSEYTDFVMRMICSCGGDYSDDDWWDTHKTFNDEFWELVKDRKSWFARRHAPHKVHHRRELYTYKRGLIMRGLDLRHLYSNKVFRNLTDYEEIFDRTVQRLPETYRSEYGMTDIIPYSLSKKRRWELEKFYVTNGLPSELFNLNFDVVVGKSTAPEFQLFYNTFNMFDSFNTYLCCKKFEFKHLVHWNSSKNEQKSYENRHGRGEADNFIKPLTNAQPNNLNSFVEPGRLTYAIHDPSTSLHFWNSTKNSRWNHKCRYECCQRKPPPRFQFTADDLELEHDPLDFDGMNEADKAYKCRSPRPMTLADYLPTNFFDLLLVSTFECYPPIDQNSRSTSSFSFCSLLNDEFEFVN
ncbi:hypothetical protein M3Y98_00826400 [Aphelenchoides besseyi]|nr:hypothetical protein M3Y98_00826400 [Aphelenchoides besseyi]KAI6195375.1 hypothetical protein M3Y96_01224500 [Aphelenchoides besseyi]